MGWFAGSSTRTPTTRISLTRVPPPDGPPSHTAAALPGDGSRRRPTLSTLHGRHRGRAPPPGACPVDRRRSEARRRSTGGVTVHVLWIGAAAKQGGDPQVE